MNKEIQNWLLIDDIRDLNCDFIARTFDAGLEALAKGGWTHLCLDHDLGEENPAHNGYEILKQGLERGLIPRNVQLVTSNPVGKQNMANALLAHGYVQLNPINFVKEP